MKKYLAIILGVLVVSQLAVSTLLIGLSNRAQRQRIDTLQRQEVTEGYLRCIFLARFDHPEAVGPDATRDHVVEALDDCSKNL